jgi:glutamine amidotransferase
VRITRSHPVTADLPDRGHFYFVNSFYADPADPAHVLGRTQYGVEFASVVGRDNVVATQFHAEKSGALGLRLLADFAAWDGRC